MDEETVVAVACPLCGNGMRFLFDTSDYRKPGEERIFRVVWCDSCAYGRVDAALTPEAVNSFYDVDYYTHQGYDEQSAELGLGEKVRRHIAWRFDRGVALQPAELGPPGRLLDVGCGDGQNMERFRRAGFSVQGVEPDPAARETASQYGIVYPGTGEDLPEATRGAFDYCLMANSLEHMISPLKALGEARAVLVDGGSIIIEVPNCAAQGFREFGPLWPWSDVPRHLHFFTVQALTRHLDAAGFAVTRKIYLGFTRQFDRWWIHETERISRMARRTGFRKSRWAMQCWGLLARTVGAPAEQKYDSIRLHAVKKP
jgi:SAM-dependent methyltransferase